jgi:hypothetical protein
MIELIAFTIITVLLIAQSIRVWINKRLTRTAISRYRRLREENHELRVRLNGVRASERYLEQIEWPEIIDRKG